MHNQICVIPNGVYQNGVYQIGVKYGGCILSNILNMLSLLLCDINHLFKFQVAELSAARKKLVGYFFLALLFLIIANIVGYVLKYYPISLDDIHLTLTSLSRHLNPTSTSTDELQ